MKNLQKKGYVFIIALLIVLLVGCNANQKDADGQVTTSDTNGEQPENQSEEAAAKPEAEPITLYMSRGSGGGEPGYDFLEVVKPMVEKKFPHITMEYAEDMKMDELIVSGQVPDIISSGYANVPDLLALSLPMDLNPLIKKHKFDLEPFIPEAINASRIYSNENELNSLPYDVNYFALFYNKEIFDQFGVDYPRDNMTWKETIEIANNVTRKVEGRQIGGLQVNSFATFGRGLALTLVDPNTNKAMLNTDGWLRVVNTLKEIHSIPGNPYIGKHRVNFVEGNTAMLAYWAVSNISMMEELTESGSLDMDWDMVSYPKFEGMKGNIEITTDNLLISQTSKHPDEAFKVIAYLTTSPEVQKFRARTANMPPIVIDGIEEIFGADRPIFEGKNVAGLFKVPALDDHIPTQYDSYAASAFRQSVTSLLNGEISDARMALLKAEEAANMDIAAAAQ